MTFWTTVGAVIVGAAAFYGIVIVAGWVIGFLGSAGSRLWNHLSRR